MQSISSRRTFITASGAALAAVPLMPAQAATQGAESARVVRRIIDAVNAGKPDVFFSLLSPAARWRAYDAAIEGGHAEYKGKEEIARYFEQLMSHYRIEHFEVDKMVAQGNSVVCFCSESVFNSKTQRREEHALVQHWTVEQGRVSRIDEYIVAVRRPA